MPAQVIAVTGDVLRLWMRSGTCSAILFRTKYLVTESGERIMRHGQSWLDQNEISI